MARILGWETDCAGARAATASERLSDLQRKNRASLPNPAFRAQAPKISSLLRTRCRRAVTEMLAVPPNRQRRASQLDAEFCGG